MPAGIDWRRILRFLAGGLLLVGVVAALVLTFRALEPKPVGGGPPTTVPSASPTGASPSGSPAPSPTSPPPKAAFIALWPEDTAAEAAVGQRSADAGTASWRLDPTQVASAYASSVLHWSAADVVVRAVDAHSVIVKDRNTKTRVALGMVQPQKRGGGGIWAVSKAASLEPSLSVVPQLVFPSSSLRANKLRLSGSTAAQDGMTVTLTIIAPSPDRGAAATPDGRVASVQAPVTGGRFSASLAIPKGSLPYVILVVRLGSVTADEFILTVESTG
jgi:hypothetical protein